MCAEYSAVASEDVLLSASAATRNYGTNTTASLAAITASVFLMRFDLSSIASTNTVTAVALKLVKTSAAEASAARTWSAYGITAANGDWVEGSSALPAASGHPCWNAKAADGSGGVTTAWAGSAGLNTAGTDYVNTVLGTVATNRANDAGTIYTMNFNADGIACVSGWLGTPNTNYGILVVSNSNTNGEIGTSENSTAGNRPVLTITYTEPSTGNKSSVIHQWLSINLGNKVHR